jgi:hypothetical protein
MKSAAVSHGLPTAVVAVEVHGHKDARPGMRQWIGLWENL